MKKSKMKKRLASAVAMLLISTMMLGTATYAWFSMNTQVTATGMSVTAKSDATFLLIKQGTATAAEIQAAKQVSDNAITATAQLYPAAHDDTITASTGYATIDAADTTTTTVKDIWYYRYNLDPAAATNNMTAITYIPTANYDNYVLVNEFSLTTATGSNELANLRVADCTITPATGGDQAVKVLVAGANGCEEFSGTGGAGTGISLQTANVTSSAASTVKIYVYWDGNDADVYTNGVADLKNTSVVVTFEGDVVPAS